jgi:hypothetical protein
LGKVAIMSDGQPDHPNASESGRGRRKKLKEDYAAAWQGFPELEGTHWAVRPVERDMALVTRDGGKLLATIGESRERKIPENDGVLIMLRLTGIEEIRIAEGLLYRGQRLGGRSSTARQFVEADSGLPILIIAGRSSDRADFGTLQLLGEGGQRAVGSEFLRFTVEGTKPENALMRAADDSGRTILRFRLALSVGDHPGLWRRLLGSFPQNFRGTEIVLSPSLEAVPELLLIAGVASPWLIGYFTRDGGGGGG